MFPVKSTLRTATPVILLGYQYQALVSAAHHSPAMLHSAFSIGCQILVTTYGFAYCLSLLWGHLQGICQYPVVSSLVRSCDVINSSTTIWTALPLLLGAQISGMETVLNETDTNVEILTDLLETRLAAINLSIVVRASSLSRRDQLSSSIERLADDALDLNRALQQLSAKIGAGFDRYVGYYFVNSRLHSALLRQDHVNE